MTSPIKQATIVRVTEAAKLLKMSKSSARRLCDAGILRPVARTQGRHRRFTREEVLRVRAMLLAKNADEVRASRIAKQRQTRAASLVLRDAKKWQRIEKWMRDVSPEEYAEPSYFAESLLDLVRRHIPKAKRKG